MSRPPSSHARLLARGRRLQWATVGWNCGEAVLTAVLGAIAGSLALIGFGVDALIEVFASSVALWHLRATDDDGRARRAHRMIGWAFLVLAAVLAAAAVRDLATGRRADESWFGVGYLTVTALVMFGLALAKKRLALRLGSGVLASEAALTFLDGVLATGTLAGLALNAVVGWWWADPLAALGVAVAALAEARESMEESRE